MSIEPIVDVIGAGLAGCEAALVLASLGVRSRLYEMRPSKMTPAHNTGSPAELVCSNSLKSHKLPSAHALLKKELGILGSPLLQAAEECAVPAGSALAVDRDRFSQLIADRIDGEEAVTYIEQEVNQPPHPGSPCIIAAGPLVSDPLAKWLSSVVGSDALFFYDAVAPIVSFDSVNLDIAFFASRRDTETADYLNCPFTKEEYEVFYSALLEADKTVAHAFEDERFFEACLPIEVAAGRGPKALLFGTLRPIGLVDPRTGRRPYAVLQLRRENLGGTSYNLVGFQTRLTIPEQKRVFRLIPGLGDAEFLRYGSIHRNSYIDAPRALNGDLSLKTDPNILVAGQLGGSEGYTESIAGGHFAARFVHARLDGSRVPLPPVHTALGALFHHITQPGPNPFAPSNINFGLIETVDEDKRIRGKSDRRQAICNRALSGLADWAEKFGVVSIRR